MVSLLYNINPVLGVFFNLGGSKLCNRDSVRSKETKHNVKNELNYCTIPIVFEKNWLHVTNKKMKKKKKKKKLLKTSIKNIDDDKEKKRKNEKHLST